MWYVCAIHGLLFLFFDHHRYLHYNIVIKERDNFQSRSRCFKSPIFWFCFGCVYAFPYICIFKEHPQSFYWSSDSKLWTWICVKHVFDVPSILHLINNNLIAVERNVECLHFSRRWNKKLNNGGQTDNNNKFKCIKVILNPKWSQTIIIQHVFIFFDLILKNKCERALAATHTWWNADDEVQLKNEKSLKQNTEILWFDCIFERNQVFILVHIHWERGFHVLNFQNHYAIWYSAFMVSFIFLVFISFSTHFHCLVCFDLWFRHNINALHSITANWRESNCIFDFYFGRMHQW